MSEPKNFYFDGLLRDCVRCTKARKALADFNSLFQGFLLVGTEPDKDFDSDLNRKNVRTFGPWSVECPECNGTGVQLTSKGMRLLGVLATFQDGARPDWLGITDKQIEAEQEIPF